MKKNFTRYLIMCFTLLMPILAFSQIKVLDEGFESGIPATWGNEKVVGNVGWVAQSGSELIYPTGAYEGVRRAAFISADAGAAIGRLITPSVSVSSLNDPILIFHYAMEKYGETGTQDTLRLYRKYNGETDWQLVKEYKDAQSFWTSDTIVIPSGTGNCQFAFAGSNGKGHGVVLDNVSIGERPLCTIVEGLRALRITHNSATLTWSPNEMATFSVIVSKTKVTNFTDPTLNIATVTTFIHNVTSLDPFTTYYFYVKANCGNNDESAWYEGTFKTGCAPITADIIDDFESYTTGNTGNFRDGCWTVSASMSDGSVPAVGYWPYVAAASNTNSCDSTRTLYLSTQNNTSSLVYSQAYAVSPKIDESVNLSEKMLSFCMYATNVTYQLHIGFCEYADDLSTYELYDVVTMEYASTNEVKTIPLNKLPLNTNKRHLVFHVSSIYQNAAVTIQLDNVELMPIPSCENTRISSSSVTTTTNSAAISWNAVNSTAWNLKVSNRPINPYTESGNIYDGNAPTNPITVPNLKSGTAYFYYIQTKCADNKTGYWSAEKKFITECSSAITEFPYKESFDTWGTGTTIYPPCWGKIGNNVYYPSVSSTANSLPGSMYFYVSTSIYAMAYTPPMGVNLNELEVTFMARGALNKILYVGTIPAGGELEDFHPTDSIVFDVANVWKKYTFKFDEYSGANNCIAFYNRTDGSTAYVDDVVVQKISSCPTPSNLTVTGKTETTVSLAWDCEGSETNWEVIYGKTGFDPYMSGAAVKSSTTKTITIDNLSSNTDYDFYVRTKCSETSISNMEGPVSTLTPQVAATIPYTDGFEDTAKNQQWTIVKNNYPVKWYTGSAAGGYEGNNSLYISANGVDNSYVNTTSYAFAYRTVDFSEGLFDIKFRWRAQGNGTADYLRVFLIPDNIDIVPTSANGISTTATPAGWINLGTYSNKIYLNVNRSWIENSASVIIENAGKYRLVFFWINNTAIIDPPAAAVDNVSVTVNTECMSPVKSTVTNRHDDAAVINFVGYNTATWNLKVSSTDLKNAIGTTTADAFDGPVTTKSVQITGLQPATTYYYYIQASCEDANTWNEKGTFTTRCARVNIPYCESFDTYGTSSSGINNSFPTCWSRLSNYSTTMGFPYINTTRVSGVGALYYLNNTNVFSMAISPRINVESFEGLQASFYLRVSGSVGNRGVGAYMTVGIMEDPEDRSTFVPIKNVQGFIDAWDLIEVPLESYTGTGRYIAVVAPEGIYSGQYLDDFCVTEIPPCPNPYDRTETNLTATGVTLKWEGYTTNYMVVVSANPLVGTESEIIAGAIYAGVVTGKELSLASSLRPNTEYYWSIRTICEGEEEGEFGEWLTVRTFRTSCPEVYGIPFRENFDDDYPSASSQGSVQLKCWYKPQVYSTYSYVYNQNSTSFPNGYYMMSGSTDESQENVIATPKLNVANAADLTVKFNGSISSGNKLVIGVMTDPNDIKTFVSVDTIIGIDGYGLFSAYSSNLAKYTGTGKHVAFRVLKSNSATLDDIVIEYTNPSCAVPGEVIASAMNSNSAKLNWIENGLPDSYTIKTSTYRIDAEFENGDGVVINDIYTNFYTLTGLNSSSTYYVYVQAVCDGGNKSGWTEAVVVNTTCPPASLPFREDFSTYGTGTQDNFPTCWNRSLQRFNAVPASLSALPYIMADNNGALSMHPYWFISSDRLLNSVTLAITPELAVEDITKCQMTFRYASADKLNCVLVVGVMTDWSDPSTFVPVDTFETKGSNYWFGNQVVNFSNYKGNGKFVAFKADGTYSQRNYGYEVRFDDVYIDYTPECAAPHHITNTVNTSNSLGFTWEAGKPTDTQWVYILSKNSWVISSTDIKGLIEAPGTVAVDTVSQTNCLIEGLDEQTTYYLYVASLCGAIYPTSLNVTTACGPVDIPYTQNFRGFGAGNTGGILRPFPTCWYSLESTSMDTYARPNITVVRSDTALTMYGSTTAYTLAATPELNAEVKTLRMRFRAVKTVTTEQSLYIGVMDNPLDTTTFEFIDKITFTPANEWFDFRVSFDKYTGTGKHVAFWAKTGENCAISFTGVVIETIVDCDIPENVEVTDRTASSFGIKWDLKGKYPVWEVIYGPLGFDPNGTEGTSETVVVPNFTASVPANTIYDVYVRNICGENDKSDWSDKLTIVTLQANPVTVPHCFDFENPSQDADWTFSDVNQPNRWAIGTAESNGTSSRGMYISNNGGTDNSYDVTKESYSFVYRTVELPVGRYDISFKWKSVGETSANDYLRVFLVRDSALITSGWDNMITSSGSTPPTGWIAIGNGLYNVNGWTEQKITTDIVRGKGGRYNLVFYWRNNATNGTQPPAAIDDICITKADCTLPIELKATNITGNSAQLNWFNYNSQSFQLRVYTTDIEVTRVNSITPDVLQVDDVRALSYPTGNILSPSTRYYFYVKADCLDTWVRGSFMTTCPPVDLPIVEKFDTYGTTTTSYMDCWTKLNTISATSYYPYVYSGTPYSGVGSLYMSSTKTGYSMAISPALNVADMNSVYLSFMNRDGNYNSTKRNYIVVGVMENPDDYATFTPMDTIWGTYNVWMPTNDVKIENYTGNGKHIAFLSPADTTNTFHIDDLRIGCIQEYSYNDVNCAGYAYRGHGFNIAREQLATPGSYTFDRTAINKTTGCDSIIYLHLTVGESTYTEIERFTCEGTPYTGDGHYNLTVSGDYPLSHKSSTLCDSIVVLKLTVIPKFESISNETTCADQLPYRWRGQDYSASGTYYDNLKTVLTNCDSVYVLNLSVVPKLESSFSANICEGDVYDFHGDILTTGGTYLKVLQSVSGCDSTVTLALNVNRAYNDTIVVTTCRGTVFNGHGFTGLTQTGKYTLPGTSVAGCDSIFTLDLRFSDAITTLLEATICEGTSYTSNGFNVSTPGLHEHPDGTLQSVHGCDSIVQLVLIVAPTYTIPDDLTIYDYELPYDYDGNIIEEGTETGIHRFQLTSVYGCDSIIVLNLTVLDGGYNVINKQEETFYLIPNPVKLGESVYIEYEFSPQEREGLVVEIFNNAGTCVSRLRPNQYPINVGENINSSGMYMIRVTTGTNKVLLGKLIVK